jgi:hypothetical protein
VTLRQIAEAATPGLHGGANFAADAAFFAASNPAALLALIAAGDALAAAADALTLFGPSNRSGAKYAAKVAALDALDDAASMWDRLEPGRVVTP